MSRADAIKFVKRQHAHALADDDDLIESITTGSLAIDIITGIGGFPRGRMSEVFGWEGSGKTTLCMMACAAAQRMGFYPVYIDIERGLDPTLAHRLGFNIHDQTIGFYLKPNTLEETLSITEEFAKSGECDLICVDSVPAMTPESIFEGKMDDTGKIGEQSRLLSSTLPRITKTIEKSKTALVFTNQMRQTLGAAMGPYVARESKEHTAGGSAPRFYSSLRIEMAIVKKGEEKTSTVDLFSGKDVDIALANRHRAKAFKNKVATPYRECTFLLRYDEARDIWGIDNRQTILDIGLSQGVIVQKGAMFLFNDGGGLNFNANGREALYNTLYERPDILEAIRQRVYELPAVKAALRLP